MSLEYSAISQDFEYPDAKVVEWEGKELFIKQYLPSSDKYGIIYMCLMSLNLKENSYNPLIAEILFDIEIVKEYSNIILEDVEDSYFKQFDVLQNKGLIDLIVENIPKEEYEELSRLYYESIEAGIKYNGNIANSINGLLDSLPTMVADIDTDALENGVEMITKLAGEKHI